MHPFLVRSEGALAELVPRLMAQAEIAIDCEFHTEGRYHADLCLVQLGFSGELWAIQAHHVDLAALGPALASPDIRKLVHDGRQDLPILARATRTPQLRGFFDTQIAAAFAGFGGSIGYAPLVRELAGIELDKSLQVSDWTRELSDAQIDYALDDVRYLGRVAASLRERLSAAQRLAWVEEACAEAGERALSRPDPEKLYRRVASTGRLGAEQLGILREIAKWRDRVAETIDKPPVTVANDLALKSIAYQAPRELRALGAVRGLGAGRAQPWASELIEAVARGLERPEVVPRPTSRDDAAVIDGLAALLGLARKVVAAREGMAAEVLADQGELRALAEWHLEGRPEGVEHGPLAGWRASVFGELSLAVLDGNVAFRADAAAVAGIAIERVSGGAD